MSAAWGREHLMKRGQDVPGRCSELHVAPHTSAIQWANKLEMQTHTYTHTQVPSPVPSLTVRQGLWTWQGGKVPQRLGDGRCDRQSVYHYYISSHLLFPSHLLTLLCIPPAPQGVFSRNFITVVLSVKRNTHCVPDRSCGWGFWLISFFLKEYGPSPSRYRAARGRASGLYRLHFLLP